MGFKDLREFITGLDEAGELHRIKTEVDWNLELSNIVRKVAEQRGPACLFEKVKDSKFPLFSGGLFGYNKVGIAVGTKPDLRSILQKLMEACNKPIPPVTVDSGPCKENIDTGDKIDLEIFPNPKWHHLDGGRFIGTMGVVFTKDPDTGLRNMAVYRHQLMGKDKIGLDIAGQHGGIHLQKYVARKQPMPFATAIGVPPELIIAGAIKAPYGADEVGIAGAIAGEPIQLVKCETIDLEVPATAEMVFEGEIPPDNSLWELEGPFGEFPGHFGTLEARKKPTGYLKAVTYRDDPIEAACSPGIPPNESSTIRELGQTIGTWQTLLKSGIPGIKEVYASEMSCGFRVVVSVDRQFYLGNARQIIFSVFQFGYLAKWVIVVDDDIDIYDSGQLEWAMSVRVQPHRDIIITDDRVRGNAIDPSVHPDNKKSQLVGQTSKIGIDATLGFKGFEFPPMVLPTEEEKKLVEKRWQEYGFR
ncbi:UbiD family decarboxylase [Thermodesulfobacteriota bacterium]